MTRLPEPDRFRARCIAAALVWLVAIAWAPASAAPAGPDAGDATADVGASQIVAGHASAIPGRAVLAIESTDDDDDDRSAALARPPVGVDGAREHHFDVALRPAAAPARTRPVYLTSPKTSPPVHPSR